MAQICEKYIDECIKNGLPEGANEGEFEIVPPKKKGVPKMLRELVDTFIVTLQARIFLIIYKV